MGTWEDAAGNVWSAVADLGQDIFRERFRCMVSVHLNVLFCLQNFLQSNPALSAFS